MKIFLQEKLKTHTTIEVFVKYGDTLWVPWFHYIIETTTIEMVSTVDCKLQHLFIPAFTILQSICVKIKLEIMFVEIVNKVYFNLRLYGHQLYELFNLPKRNLTRYVGVFKHGYAQQSSLSSTYWYFWSDYEWNCVLYKSQFCIWDASLAATKQHASGPHINY